MDVEDDDDSGAVIQTTLTTANAASKSSLRRMKRTQGRAITAEIQAREAHSNVKLAAAKAEVAKASGVDRVVMSLARAAVTLTGEALAITMAALKEASEEHSRARDRSRHALAVGMCATGALGNFIQEDEGCLEEAGRERAGDIRHTYDECAAEFEKLDSDITEPYQFAPSLLINGSELDFVCDRYEAPVREQLSLPWM